MLTAVTEGTGAAIADPEKDTLPGVALVAVPGIDPEKAAQAAGVL